ncbi:MAG: hypothetical protein WCH35_10075 [Comamonadaceae bacterium]
MRHYAGDAPIPDPSTYNKIEMYKTLFLMLVALLLSACGGGDEGNALMRPGEDCLAAGCHSAGSEHQFTLAGTVFPSATAVASAGLANVTVVVQDAVGNVTTLTTNAAGNFFTNAGLALPLASVYLVRNGQRTDMGGAPRGACASCHILGSSRGAVFAN